MKKIRVLTFVAAVAGAMAAQQVLGSMSVVLNQDTGQYSYGNGGEFRATGNAELNSIVNWSAYSADTAVQNQYFQTFCTEQLETFTPGTTYEVSSIGNDALYNGGGPPGVPITMGVAYLYSQFAAGTLIGYDYTYGSGRVATAGDLQKAIWYLLGENGDGAGLATWIENDLTSGLGGTLSDWQQAANGAYGVKDMVVGNAGVHQDQLVIVVPEATTIIAGALLLLPLGACTLRILRRNRMA